MFRGISAVSIDNKGRLAVPSRFRDRLALSGDGRAILTLNPLDRALWLYPLPEWELIEAKLAALSDFDRQSRRAKQMMRGYAAELELDAQGRILVPPELRRFAELKRQAVVLGQGNKIEIWDADLWSVERDQWLAQIGDDGEPSERLKSLSL